MLITIITINYNNLEGLKKTMQSVLKQTYSKIEFIIIDGGSMDGSKEYIESCQQHLSYWVSEPDQGIYHAMNKGIDQAKGNYLLFLNSGDWLVSDDVLNSIKPVEFSHDLISCGLQVVGDHIEYNKEVPDVIRFSFMYKSTLPHQSTFIKRNLFNIIGYYDQNLKFVSDWKFFILAICKYNASFCKIPTVISNYNLFGYSSIQKNLELLKLERKSVLSLEFEPYVKDMESLIEVKSKIASLRKSKWIRMLLKYHLINKF